MSVRVCINHLKAVPSRVRNENAAGIEFKSPGSKDVPSELGILMVSAVTNDMAISYDVTVKRKLTSARSFKKPHRAFDCFPRKVSA